MQNMRTNSSIKKIQLFVPETSSILNKNTGFFHGFSMDFVASRGYKTHMLGNIKLVGGLLARGMLAAKAWTKFKKHQRGPADVSPKNMFGNKQSHRWLRGI